MPEKIGKYRVVGPIGRGGMGMIFKAHDPVLDRVVALKVIPTESEGSRGLRARFYREAQACARLSHPNIVTIYELGEDSGALFIAMEFLHGVDLKELIAERRGLSLADKVGMALAVCDGLQYAHMRGVVHRDIKPANIMVLVRGGVKILDFGIAQLSAVDDGLTRPGSILGTLRYMAPEQVRGRADHRSDIFSLGAVLYEFLCLRPAFDGADPVEILDQLRADAPVPLGEVDPTLPPDLSAIVERAMSKDPVERFADVAQFRAELEAVHNRIAAEQTHPAPASATPGPMSGGDTLAPRVELLKATAAPRTSNVADTVEARNAATAAAIRPARLGRRAAVIGVVALGTGIIYAGMGTGAFSPRDKPGAPVAVQPSRSPQDPVRSPTPPVRTAEPARDADAAAVSRAPKILIAGAPGAARREAALVSRPIPEAASARPPSPAPTRDGDPAAADEGSAMIARPDASGSARAGRATAQELEADRAQRAAATARSAAEHAGARQHVPEFLDRLEAKERDASDALNRREYGLAVRLFDEVEADYQTAARQAQRVGHAARRELGALGVAVEQARARMHIRRTDAVAAEAERLAKPLFDAAQAKHVEADSLATSASLTATREAYQEASERYVDAELKAKAVRETRIHADDARGRMAAEKGRAINSSPFFAQALSEERRGDALYGRLAYAESAERFRAAETLFGRAVVSPSESPATLPAPVEAPVAARSPSGNAGARSAPPRSIPAPF